MPIQRRVPKRGFNVPQRTAYKEVSVGDLRKINGDIADAVTVRAARLVKGRGPIVLLGNGEIDRPLTVKVHRITKGASDKIIAAGGSVEIVALDPVDRRVKKGPRSKAKRDKKAE